LTHSVYSAAVRPSPIFPPLSFLRASLLTATLAASLASAQAPGDWSTFPPSSTPAAPPPAAVKSAPSAGDKQPEAQPPAASPAPATAPTPEAAPASDAPKPSATPPQAAPPKEPQAPSPTPPKPQPAQAGASSNKRKPAATRATRSSPGATSTRERFLPGSEPHSPSTLRNGWADPRNLRHTSSGAGDVGLLRVAGADLGRHGLLRFSATGEYFNNTHFPVRDAENTRTAGTFALSYVPFEALEIFAAYTVSANTNSRSSPNLIQALGDMTLGVKSSRQWARGFWAGVDLRIQSFSGVGNQDVGRYAFGFVPRVLSTYDLRQLHAKLPLRAHGNIGLILDGTDDLVRTTRLNAAEEYALNVNRFNRLGLGIGVEAPLPAVTPFAEFTLAYPLGVGSEGLVAPDGQTVSAASAARKTFNLGAKITAVRDVTFNVGAEFGLTRTVGLGVPATPPFNLFFGATYTVDLLGRGETRIIEMVRERKVETPVAPQTAQVSGVVLDSQTRKPIPGVLVTIPGAGLPPVATDMEKGRFLTHPLPPGAVRIAVQKEGYRLVEQDLTLKAGETSTVELALEPMARPALFTLSTTSKGKPVAATLRLQGPKAQEFATSEAATAPAKLEVPAGRYTVNVTAQGYLAQTRDVQVSEGATLELSFELEPEPKKKLVEVKDNKIEILQQVHFRVGKAIILADSYPLLAQVVDAIVRNDIQRVRIEGHTDNQGNPQSNLQLSKDRAQAVAAHLIKAGIDASRLDVEGFGDTRPIAPNLTPRGRELNRRVEFVILER
jgi:OOP family OmpA-OmpF porin